MPPSQQWRLRGAIRKRRRSLLHGATPFRRVAAMGTRAPRWLPSASPPVPASESPGQVVRCTRKAETRTWRGKPLRALAFRRIGRAASTPCIPIPRRQSRPSGTSRSSNPIYGSSRAPGAPAAWSVVIVREVLGASATSRLRLQDAAARRGSDAPAQVASGRCIQLCGRGTDALLRVAARSMRSGRCWSPCTHWNT